MSTWDTATLTKMARADDLHVAPYRSDGMTTGTPTWIWSVVVDGDLFARAATGRQSSWYQAAIGQSAGRIHIGGNDYEVEFAPVDAALADAIDAAYAKKYRGSPYVAPMIERGPREAGVRIRPVGS